MAQLDTGLGWSAKDNYLSSLGPVQLGTLAGMTDPNGVFVEIPGGLITELEVAQGGYCYAETSTYKWMCAAEDNVQVYVFKPTGQNYIVGVKMGYGGKMLTVRVKKSDGSTSRFDYKQMNDSRGNGLYSGTATMGTGNWEVPTGATIHLPELGTGSTLAATINNAISTNIVLASQDWYKLNPGYAVCCFATYNNMDGGKTITPVLISTEFSATILSNDGTTQATFATYRYLKDGRHFYMSMVPTSTLNVSSSTVTQAMLTNFAVLVPEGVFNALARSDWANILVTETVDPYDDPPSSEQGGDGTDPIDDEVPLEPVVFPSVLSTGFCRLYCPSSAQLTALSNYLWGPLFDLSAVKKLFADPMDSLLGLSVVPLSISGVAETVSVAGVSTGVELDRLSAQHINVSLGSLRVVEKWGAYLDYEPYTKYSIYLPFIGYRTLSADDIMGKWVNLSYDIDLLSGACVAKLTADGTLLYQWAGTCAMQVPINASNWNSVIQSTISTIGSVATGIATGGAAAPLVVGSIASAATQATNMKPSVERAGGLSGAAAFLSGRRAYMIRTYPEHVKPANQPHYGGYPSFITKRLGDLTGYNVVEDIHLEGIPATQAELEEIDTLLHEGVIL